MRALAGCFACFAALGSVSLAAPPAHYSRAVHLRGYYQLDLHPTWRLSDRSPWYLLRSAPWADWRLLKWGYVPVEHDGKHFLCLIADQPLTGTRLPGREFMCGDPRTAASLYDMGWKPTILLYGSH